MGEHGGNTEKSGWFPIFFPWNPPPRDAVMGQTKPGNEPLTKEAHLQWAQTRRMSLQITGFRVLDPFNICKSGSAVDLTRFSFSNEF